MEPGPESGKRSAYRFESPGVTAFRRWAATVSPEQALIALMLARAEEALSNTKSIHGGYLDESVRIAADATVAMLDAQSFAWGDGDKKAKQLLHLGEHARKLRSYDRPVRIDDGAQAQEEGAGGAG